ncbi:Stage 0 sporulation protein KE [Sedimentisphaera cyanobacteriorum]|uniref:Stage 0 sporulation protein KE n=1 Tax=Sedimentisphaera cyanobacteriorum TaxID=1940790 RepID=A0A1Q2HNE1_9BACT|nr:dipeptide ABC transporter ATP-binding protein [Sedimentisphaera cyanobacteriorum]AQQ08968.1 Stage 0 sporulation protein KE [Sedimentisphaera cyanobacteriorum]
MSETLIKVENLKTHFPVRKGLFSKITGYVKAVDGVSFEIPQGKTLGLVGESGCGKTTIGRTMLRLVPSTSGEVFYKDKNVLEAGSKELTKLRRDMQIIFQDPYGSLNPRMTVGKIVGEALSIHKIAKGEKRQEIVAELLSRTGLSPDYINRYPHEFSGGQRQRIGIARALALNPNFIVCDEAVSALDVSLQSQIINLLMDLQDEFGLTYLFIAHDLAVVEHISDIVAVMYLGRIVEISSADELYKNPIHPYTKALMSAIPRPEPSSGLKRIVLEGEVPSPINPPSGCPFHPRCRYAEQRCAVEVQSLKNSRLSNGHKVACWKFA